VDRTTVQFETTGAEADGRLVREYVLPAMERLPEREDCADVGFLRYGHSPAVDGGQVRLYLRGDTEAVVAEEADRWDRLVEDGLAREWTVAGPEDDSDTFGPTGAEVAADLQMLASQMSRHVVDRLDDAEYELAPVDTVPEEGPVPVGWWSLLHFLADQRALSADEEIDAYAEGVRNRLWTLATVDGADRAHERIDDLVATLESVRDEVDAMTDDGDDADAAGDTGRDNGGDTDTGDGRA